MPQQLGENEKKALIDIKNIYIFKTRKYLTPVTNGFNSDKLTMLSIIYMYIYELTNIYCIITLP